MQALIINNKIKNEINNLVEFAKANPVSLEQLKRTVEGTVPPIGDDPRYALNIDVGFRVVFSIEQQPQGLMRHLSIGMPYKPKDVYPSHEVASEIMRLFGFSGTSEAVAHSDYGMVWPEEDCNVVNILEYIDPPLKGGRSVH